MNVILIINIDFNSNTFSVKFKKTDFLHKNM